MIDISVHSIGNISNGVLYFLSIFLEAVTFYNAAISIKLLIIIPVDYAIHFIM